MGYEIQGIINFGKASRKVSPRCRFPKKIPFKNMIFP
jgi:hypothetical protein